MFADAGIILAWSGIARICRLPRTILQWPNLTTLMHREMKVEFNAKAKGVEGEE